MTALPDITTPDELAKRLGWSERRVRDKARELGACRILGNRMILLPEDVAQFERLIEVGYFKSRIGGTIYIIQGGPFVKIGWSLSSEKRLAHIQTYCPYKIEVLATIDGDEKLERELHSRFSHLRVEGEWFKHEGELASWIEGGCL